jgi:membrane protease YdiL (CAAX protease family)
MGIALRSILFGLLVAGVLELPWSLLASLNLRLSPRAPWAVLFMGIYAALVLAYLNGLWPPRSSTQIRRSWLRLRWLLGPEWGWAMLAGTAGALGLWLLYAAAGYLSVPVSAPSGLDLWVWWMAVLSGAAVTAIAEESGFRGYMQTPLEQRFGPAAAIAIVSVAFVAIHLTHGLPALLRNGPFYLAASILYGVLAYLTRSILPSLLLHFAGDVLLFAWLSSLVHLHAPDTGPARVACAVGAVVATVLSIAAFRKLASVSQIYAKT